MIPELEWNKKYIVELDRENLSGSLEDSINELAERMKKLGRWLEVLVVFKKKNEREGLKSDEISFQIHRPHRLSPFIVVSFPVQGIVEAMEKDARVVDAVRVLIASILVRHGFSPVDLRGNPFIFTLFMEPEEKEVPYRVEMEKYREWFEEQGLSTGKKPRITSRITWLSRRIPSLLRRSPRRVSELQTSQAQDQTFSLKEEREVQLQQGTEGQEQHGMIKQSDQQGTGSEEQNIKGQVENPQ